MMMTCKRVHDFSAGHRVVGPAQLAGTDVVLNRVTVEETRNCSAEAVL